MPRTDKRVEDEFAILTKRWLTQKRKADKLRDEDKIAELQGALKRMKSTARQMKKMLDGKQVLGAG